MKKDDRMDAVFTRQEIFTADGTLGQILTFTASGCVPNGILEVATRTLNEKWVDLTPSRYTLATDGKSMQLEASFSVPAGHLIRVVYVPDEDTVQITGTLDTLLKDTVGQNDIDDVNTQISGWWRAYDDRVSPPLIVSGNTVPLIGEYYTHFFDRDRLTALGYDTAIHGVADRVWGQYFKEETRLERVSITFNDVAVTAGTVRLYLFFADGTSAFAVNRTVVGITNGTTLYYDVNKESPVERYVLTFTGLGAGDRMKVTSIVFHRNNTIGITEVKEVTTLMNAVAVASGTTVYSTAVDCVNIKRTALTVRETWGAGGLTGATVELQSSYDGTNWDTEPWIDGLETTPFTVAPPYPATQQVTSNIDPIPRYYRVAVTNNDASPVTVTVITTEVE